MNPKQRDIVRATYRFPWGSRPIGIVKLDNGHSVVTASGLEAMLGYFTAGHLVGEYRIAMCCGGTDPETPYRRRQVFGLIGIRDALQRGQNQQVIRECDDLVAWFAQQGVSSELWPVQSAPRSQKRYIPYSPASGNPKLRDSLSRLVLVDDGGGKDSVNSSGSPFDAIRQVDQHGREYWSARGLMVILGYDRWERFADAIERAMLSCERAGHSTQDHFVDASKMVEIGSGCQRRVDDWHLSRYACYLTALNGDVRKQQIADAQAYFVIRTRQAEAVSSENLTQILGVMMEQIRTTREHAVALVDHERRIVEAAEKAEKALAEIQRMQEARPVFEGVYTIQEFARHLGVPLQSARKLRDRQELGEFLSEICRDRDVKGFIEGYRTTELGHSVNGYPVEILREFKNHFVDFEGTRPERAVVIPRLKKFISDQKPTAFDFTRRSN